MSAAAKNAWALSASTPAPEVDKSSERYLSSITVSCVTSPVLSRRSVIASRRSSGGCGEFRQPVHQGFGVGQGQRAD
jgi:hypothetical protein